MELNTDQILFKETERYLEPERATHFQKIDDIPHEIVALNQVSEGITMRTRKHPSTRNRNRIRKNKKRLEGASKAGVNGKDYGTLTHHGGYQGVPKIARA